MDEGRRPHTALVSCSLGTAERIVPGPGVRDSSVVVRVDDDGVLQGLLPPQHRGDQPQTLVYPGHQATAPPPGGVPDVTAELLVPLCRQQRVVGSQVGEKHEEGRGGVGLGQMGFYHLDGLHVEQVRGVGGVVPVHLVVPPEVKPPVPALLGEVVLTPAQDSEELMEASSERMVGRLGVSKVPLQPGFTIKLQSYHTFQALA